MLKEWIDAVNSARRMLSLTDLLPDAKDDRDLNTFLAELVPKLNGRFTHNDFLVEVTKMQRDFGEDWLPKKVRSHTEHRAPCTLNGLVVAYALLMRRKHYRLISCWPSVPNELQMAFTDCGVAMRHDT